MKIRMVVEKAEHITDDHMSTRNGRIPPVSAPGVDGV